MGDSEGAELLPMLAQHSVNGAALMPIPARFRTAIYRPWGLLPGFPARNPLAKKLLDDPVAEPKAEDAQNEKEPVEDCSYHFGVPPIAQSSLSLASACPLKRTTDSLAGLSHSCPPYWAIITNA